MYTNEEKAINLVFKAFAGKKRIKEDIDMASHSILVGYLLKNAGYNEEIVLTGLLHDLVEDTEITAEEIAREFGSTIADNVLQVSENKSIEAWMERKGEFLVRLKNSNDVIIIVELADKLHNLLSDYDSWKKIGNKAIETLATTYDMNRWYYLELADLFNKRIDSDNELLKRFNTLIEIYFK